MAARKACIETYGCSFNQSESDLISESLEKRGWIITSDPCESDVIVINSCAVKESTENRIIERMRDLTDRKKRLVVCGCLTADPDRIRRFAQNATIVKTMALGRIADAVEDALEGNATLFDRYEDRDRFLPRAFSAPVLRVPINDGCTGRCNYCATRLARPKLRSFPREGIISRVREGIIRGAKEIRLVSPDTGAYGLDTGDDTASLLEAIGDTIEESGADDVRVRLGMMNPDHASRMKKGLAEQLNRGFMFRFIHLPVQSGSEKVCADMGRSHKVAQFEALAGYLRKKVPDIAIATDLIAGYPTEKPEDHEMTREMLLRIKPDMVNVSKFCPRPGTLARRLVQLDDHVRKERAKELLSIARLIAEDNGKAFIGSVMEVIITECAKDPKGRDRSYRQVALPCAGANAGVMIGSSIRARIVDSRGWTLIGERTRD